MSACDECVRRVRAMSACDTPGGLAGGQAGGRRAGRRAGGRAVARVAGCGGGGGGGGDRGTSMYYVTPRSFQACTATMDSDCSSLARRARKARSCNLLAILALLVKPEELEDCCS